MKIIQKNIFSNIIGSVIKILLSVLTIPTITYNLGIEQFGLYSLANSFIGFLLLNDFGISHTVFFFTSQIEKSKNNYFEVLSSLFISVCIVVGLFCLLFWLVYLPVIFRFYKKSSVIFDTLNTLLPIVFFIILLKILHLVVFGFLEAKNETLKKNIIETIISILQQFGVILIALYSKKLSDIYIYILFINGLITIYLFRGLLKDIAYNNFKFIPQFPLIISQIKYSFSIFLNNIGSVLFTTFDKIIVGKYFDLEFLGFYSFATSIASMINGFANQSVRAFNFYLLKKRNLQLIVLQMTKVSSIVIILITTVLILFNFELYSIFIKGKSNFKNTDYLIIVFSIYGIYSSNVVGYNFLICKSYLKELNIINLAGGLGSIGLIFLSSVYGNKYGVFFANSMYCVTIFFNFFTFKKVGILFLDYFKIVSFYILTLIVVIILVYLNPPLYVRIYVALIVILYSLNKWILINSQNEIFDQKAF